MKLFADYHTHTVFSDGLGTVRENAASAAARGLSEVAITDHGPRNIVTGMKGLDKLNIMLEEVARVNRLDLGVKVLAGLEASVVSSSGELELSRRAIKQLDLLVAGLHPYFLPRQLKDLWHFVLPNHLGRVRRSSGAKLKNTNTKALTEAVRRYPVDIVSHPNFMMPVELQELAPVCAERNSSLEINTGHVYNKDMIVLAAQKAGAKLVINSDAHTPQRVGDLASGLALVERLKFPLQRVVNLRLE
ncbi:PHP domain protein [Desulfofarcimen acetoxidans DSM 771]|uniref:PHP domain protein n=1 Tax=Desulfofarcimen acetoxidans (strain ATCC 49208 / DSM 771 / KCTC 5769 / VKM B-1644 / 5575) TaxID=485916 RepID=C8VY06_DESAS|nr:PHP domain-containing protein [Desulfofarcimen acetoxidans]ACV64635.1 PHP domain protein [Desulfofarcimen acetoxidans DSM 771]